MTEKDYTHRGWIAALTLVGVLVCVSLIPPQTLGGIKLKRANILSDLITFDDAREADEAAALYDEQEFEVDMELVTEQINANIKHESVQTTFEWSIPAGADTLREIIFDTTRLNPTLVPIEDFDTTGMSPMYRFYQALLTKQLPIRIAVLGDSFVEGDILTADLRENLQLAYGGGGAGFAPFASPLTAFRRTIKTQSTRWTSYNIMQRKTTPQPLRENFYISGWVCQPQTGASTRWESTDFRKCLKECRTARILFISANNSQVKLTLNDSLSHHVTIPGGSSVRQITVSAPQIRTLSFEVLSGAEGFIGYGVVFEAPGVVVDNYSIRSNNGQAMFWTNPSVNAQINTLLGYDLIILQYGLNIMQTEVKNYTNYAEQIKKMVVYVQECFPTAAILLLGVSDRSVKTSTGFEAMDAIPHMLRYQQLAAENRGAAFWNTRDAMQTLGGMERFVANGWAGKDFTHINYAGGRQIARSLFDAINSGAQKIMAKKSAEKQPFEQIIDTPRLTTLYRQLNMGITPATPKQ